MKLSTRLTIAMVALVMLTAAAVGALNHYDVVASALLGGLVAVLCAAALAMVIARSLTKPLVEMTMAVERIAREEAIAVPANASGEIGVLARAFAQMGNNVREKTAALRRAIEESSRIFETSPDLILVTDSQGNFIRVNTSSQAILGYDPHEMIGRSALEFISADDLEPTRNEMRAARRGQQIRNFESRYIHKDGRAVTLAWSGAWSEPEQRHFFIGRDMTEQRFAEEKFKLAVEASPSGIAMFDADGVIVLVNAETERLFGYSREELIGRSIDTLVSAARRDWHSQHRSAVVAGPRARRAGEGLEFNGRRKDGTEFPVEVNLNSIESRNGLLVMSVIVDVTERRKAEQALAAESEGRRRVAEVLNNTVTSMADAVLVADAKGKLIIINPAAKKLFDFMGVDAADYVQGYDRFYPDGVTPLPFEATPLFRTVRGEPVDDLEYVVRPRGATEGGVHLIASGRPLRDSAGELQGAVTIYRDITASRQAQEALRESERMARGIIANSLDAIVQVKENGEVIEWNPQAETIFGWSRPEAVGQSLTELYLPKGYRPRYLDMNEQLRAADGQVGDRFELDAQRKDGRKIKVEVSMTGVRRRNGNIYNLFLRDITAKVAAEEQLRQSQKMEAVGQLTGGIAHDFNNMLTVITGTIDILADAVADQPQLVAITKLISEAADRGAELTGHLLAFARKQPLQPRETDINQLVIDSAKLLRPALGERVEIESILDENIWPALVDPTQLTTALLNLAVNARDAMPDGGKVTLETKNIILDRSYADAIGDIEPGNYVLIAVSDTGSGIPAAIRDKVFEPFFSTKEVGKGTGLGLSMVYGFVKQSGGHIRIYSEEGHGTTIRIYLPQAGTSAGAAAATPAPEIEGGSETILIVEDNPLVLNSATTQLASLGYQTLRAANAAEALTLIDGGATFDLLFTDVIMPGSMNGRELAEEVAKRRSSVKVLFTSGYTEDAVIHHGRLEPGVLLLAKPYRKVDLARMVRVALTAAAMVPRPQPELPRAQVG